MRSLLRSIIPGLVVALALVAAAPASASYTFTKLPRQQFTTGPYATPTEPGVAAVGDVNGDGHQDVVLGAGDSRVSGLEVELGHGDGTFTALAGSGTIDAEFGTPNSIVIADMDGDGKPDVAYESGGGIYVAWGNGDGTFQAGKLVPASTAFANIAAVDVNGDGTADLLAPDGFSPNLYVFELHHDRSVSPPGIYPLALAGGPITVADVNGDGHADVVVASDPPEIVGGAGSVATLLGHGDGTFGAPMVTPAGHDPLAVRVGDVNGDGHPDIVTANFGADETETDEFWVLAGHGDGTFTPTRHRVNTAANPSDVAIGDVDGDGKPDLTFVGHNGYMTWRGDGAGGFTLDQEGGVFGNPWGGGEQLATGDFNGDGHPDVATGGGLVALDVLPTRMTVTQVMLHGGGPHKLPGVRAIVRVPQAGTVTVAVTTTLPTGRHVHNVLRATETGRTQSVLSIALNVPARHRLLGIRLTYTFRPKAGGAAQVLHFFYGPQLNGSAPSADPRLATTSRGGRSRWPRTRSH